MRQRVSSIILFLFFLSMSSISIAHTDACISTKKVSRCDFSSLKNSPGKTVYFYCNTKKSNAVEMYSSDVLVRGFHGSINTGTGRLSLRGKKEVKTLNKKYFRVLLSPISQNAPNIRIYSDHDITCKIGKGIWRSEMTGDLD